MRTLNGSQAAKGREMHLCPLQLDIVDRLINRYSNRGDVVFDPFMGLGTVLLRALLAGRRGLGVELNPFYFADAVRYLKEAEEKAATPSLFDIEALTVETTEAAEERVEFADAVELVESNADLEDKFDALMEWTTRDDAESREEVIDG